MIVGMFVVGCCLAYGAVHQVTRKVQEGVGTAWMWWTEEK